MGPHALYEPNDRVWLKMDGYDWWPARIVSDEELHENGQTRPEGCDITVYFYEGTTTSASLEHFHTASANISFFETSSEKAVTDDADRLAAIRHAKEDTMANPLKYEFVIAPDRGGTSKASEGASVAAAAALAGTSATTSSRRGAGDVEHEYQRPVSKRTREVQLAGRHSGAGANSQHQQMLLLPDERLIEIAERVSAAVEARDLPSLRIELCDLDAVSVTLRQLETTKVGVAIGNILGQKDLESLWPLARAIISSWARVMPLETIETIKRYQVCRLGRRQDDTNNTSTARGASMMSPVGAGAPPFVGTNKSDSLHASLSADGGERAPTRFFHRVRKLLDAPADPPIPNITSDDLDAVAEELCRDVVESEDRKHLQEQLAKPAMGKLRQSLITRALSGKDFLRLPRSALMTEEEKVLEEARITKMIEDQDKVKMANVAITSLFTCPSCGKKRCSFYEQQTRSADEPTTKFLTCLECKYAWTTE